MRSMRIGNGCNMPLPRKGNTNRQSGCSHKEHEECNDITEMGPGHCAGSVRNGLTGTDVPLGQSRPLYALWTLFVSGFMCSASCHSPDMEASLPLLCRAFSSDKKPSLFLCAITHRLSLLGRVHPIPGAPGGFAGFTFLTSKEGVRARLLL